MPEPYADACGQSIHSGAMGHFVKAMGRFIASMTLSAQAKARRHPGDRRLNPPVDFLFRDIDRLTVSHHDGTIDDDGVDGPRAPEHSDLKCGIEARLRIRSTVAADHEVGTGPGSPSGWPRG